MAGYLFTMRFPSHPPCPSSCRREQRPAGFLHCGRPYRGLFDFDAFSFAPSLSSDSSSSLGGHPIPGTNCGQRRSSLVGHSSSLARCKLPPNDVDVQMVIWFRCVFLRTVLVVRLKQLPRRSHNPRYKQRTTAQLPRWSLVHSCTVQTASQRRRRTNGYLISMRFPSHRPCRRTQAAPSEVTQSQVQTADNGAAPSLVTRPRMHGANCLPTT